MRVLHTVIGCLRQAWSQTHEAGCPPACAMHKASRLSQLRRRTLSVGELA